MCGGITLRPCPSSGRRCMIAEKEGVTVPLQKVCSQDNAVEWSDFLEKLHASLKAVEVTTLKTETLKVHEGFALWEAQCSKVKKADGSLFFIGNGASSSMCSHFSADLGKNAGFRTQMFGDAALLTALGNDIAFDQIFAEPLRRNGRSGDMLIAISSSGNSSNIITAITVARQMGLWVLTLTGMNPANRVRQLGDLNFWVDAGSYAIVETAHAAILHHWTDRLVARHGGEV